MFRTDGKFECERSDKLYVDRWFICNTESDNPCLNDDNDIYGNRHNG